MFLLTEFLRLIVYLILFIYYFVVEYNDNHILNLCLTGQKEHTECKSVRQMSKWSMN